MSMKVVVVLALLLALLPPPAAGEAEKTPLLRQLLANREAASRREPPPPPPQVPSARMERRARLSEDEREIMTKQIMQAISEVMNSECMSDRDYQGWVDFGRRDAE
ncbi:hypothetical protein EYF80_018597 [Liparis tanakae]|uniref:Gastrin/cholecystokinin peptide hormone domain-containing protein n=1 Tax=Liparis tanakae TaxID=230148 RepID=A0A4Z2HZH1_9TELE|nr:hypothetical protein EYF80_018597 [Liparis tanakae]